MTHSSLNSILLLALITPILSHMELAFPNPRKSKYSDYYRQLDLVDWSLSAPLGNSMQQNFPMPCRGSEPGPIEALYLPGDIIKFRFFNQTSHNGGHCQFSLSYDNQKFGVLKTIIRSCFLDTLTYNIKLPESAPPSDRATIAWSWINATGTREYYMNCVDITIGGNNTRSKLILPELFIGNLPGFVKIPEFTEGYDYADLYDSQPKLVLGLTAEQIREWESNHVDEIIM